MALKKYSLQLTDVTLGTAIIAAGGKVFVAKPGTPDKATLVTKDGAAITNPMTPTRGKIEFYTDDVAAPTVDLYVQTPGGQFLQVYGVVASGNNEINVNTNERNQSMVIPFSIADTTAAAETQTGFTVPTYGAVMPAPFVRVTTLDAGQSIEVGTLSSDSGDADGYIDVVVLTTAGLKKASLLNSAVTMGALLYVQDSVNAGDKAPEADVTMGGKQITYTLNAGTDTAKGFITLPILLAA